MNQLIEVKYLKSINPKHITIDHKEKHIPTFSLAGEV